MTRDERWFVLRAGLTTTAAWALLRLAPLPTVTRVVGRRVGLPGRLPPPARMATLTDRLLALDRGPLRPSCVLRSLVLLRYLPRDDGAVTVRFGLRPGVRPVEGHAWIEIDGRPFAEPVDPREAYETSWSWP